MRYGDSQPVHSSIIDIQPIDPHLLDTPHLIPVLHRDPNIPSTKPAVLEKYLERPAIFEIFLSQ